MQVGEGEISNLIWMGAAGSQMGDQWYKCKVLNPSRCHVFFTKDRSTVND